MVDWGKYDKEVNKLIALGYKPIYFAYRIGGGEDENDDTLFIKDGKALIFSYQSGRWLECDYENCNYTNGFDYNGSDVFNIP